MEMPTGGLKLDTVAIRGFNDDELVSLIEFGKQVQAEVRFIEYMDVGGANEWAGASSRFRFQKLPRESFVSLRLLQQLRKGVFYLLRRRVFES